MGRIRILSVHTRVSFPIRMSIKYYLIDFSIYLYAAVSYDDSVYIFGGYSQYDGRIQSTIAKYDGQWSKVGDLGSVSKYDYKAIKRHLTLSQTFKAVPRHQHSAILSDFEVMVVGGDGRLVKNSFIIDK